MEHSIALYRIRYLSLPISTVTASTTILLPVFSGFILRGFSTTQKGFSLPAILLVILLAIYQTTIAVLALLHIVPTSNLGCGLEEQ